MKTLKNALGLLAALFAASVAFTAAVPSTNTVHISNEDVFALFNALNQIQPGLTAGNVGLAAQDIWNLKGIAEAFQAAGGKSARDQERAKSAKDVVTAMEAVQADWDKYRLSTNDVELKSITLSDEEIKESKITPALLAPILHYLSPK